MMFPKPPKCVSKPLRNSAKGKDCTLRSDFCNHNSETVVFCHVRAFGRSGVNTKPLDLHGFYGCSECHRNENKVDMSEIFRAVMETQEILYMEGIISVKGA